MPDDALVQHLAQQADRLDDRCRELDRRMTAFEARASTALWLGGILAAFFAVGTGVGAHYLSKLHYVGTKLKEFDTKIAQERQDLDAISGKTKTGTQSLAARISVFKSGPPQEPYVWAGYSSDLNNLTGFATEYCQLTGDSSDGGAQAAVAYDELTAATAAVKKRAALRLQGIEKQDLYDWHAEGSLDLFQYILDQLKMNAGVLNNDQRNCFQKAFPNWLHHVGMSAFPPSGADSSTCKKLIGLTAK